LQATQVETKWTHAINTPSLATTSRGGSHEQYLVAHTCYLPAPSRTFATTGYYDGRGWPGGGLNRRGTRGPRKKIGLGPLGPPV